MSNSTSFLAQTCASHLGSCITCWYMAPCVFGHFEACSGGFIRGFSHPTRHTGLRKNLFFGICTPNSTCRFKNSCKATFVLLLLYSFFPFARKWGFCAWKYSYEIVIYGQTKKMSIAAIKQMLLCMSFPSTFVLLLLYSYFFVCP